MNPRVPRRFMRFPAVATPGKRMSSPGSHRRDEPRILHNVVVRLLVHSALDGRRPGEPPRVKVLA